MMLVVLGTVLAADFAAPRGPRELESATKEIGLKCFGAQTEQFSCNEAECPVEKTCVPEDATFGLWTEWTTCDCNGYQERHRHQATFASCGGAQLEGTMVEGQPCDCECSCDPDPVDCRLSDWAEWGACSKTCGKGEHHRTRKELTQVAKCGHACGAESADAMSEVRECFLQECDDGMVEDPHACEGPWSAWSECDETTCQQHRSKTAAEGDLAEKCGEQEEVRQCMETDLFGTEQKHSCAHDTDTQDCKFRDWGVWGACTATCGGGHQLAQRELIQRKKANGKDCGDQVPVVKVRPCGMGSCNPEPEAVDGEWNDWGEWSACSTSCGPGIKHHMRTHTLPEHGGLYPQGDSSGYAACEVETCPGIDKCEFSEWEEWGACTSGSPGDTNGVEVAGNWGVRYQHRRITKYPKVEIDNIDLACHGAIRRAEPCGAKCAGKSTDPECLPPQGELSQWSAWSECSATCEGGSQKRERTVVTAGQFADGEHHTIEVQVCNTDCCDSGCDDDRDCIWGDWNSWGACTATCGGGEHQRYRMVVQHAKNQGKECALHDSYEVAPCATQSCDTAKFCVWSDWSYKTECSQTCGGGIQHRTRSLEATELEPADSEYLSSTSKVELIEEIAALRAGMDRATTHLYGLAAAVLGGVGLVALRRRAPSVSASD